MRVGSLVAALVGAVVIGSTMTVMAGDRTIFRGCVVERFDGTITVATSFDERIAVDTTWIRPETLSAALVDCVTVTAVVVEGRYVAESIEAGDEPNEVNSVTNETTADRENRARERAERENKQKD